MRHLVLRIERDDIDPSIVILNNVLLAIRTDVYNWPVRDADSIKLLHAHGFPDDLEFAVWYQRLIIDIEPEEEGYFKIKKVAYEKSLDEAHFLMDNWLAERHIPRGIQSRFIRDACWPFDTIGNGVNRVGRVMVEQIENWIKHTSQFRVELLIQPPEGMRQWGEREKQILTEHYRSPEWYDAMGLDDDRTIKPT